MVAVVVGYDGSLYNGGLSVRIVGIVLDVALTNTRDHDLVTDLKACQLIGGVDQNGDHAAVLAKEVEAVFVDHGGADDALDGNGGVDGGENGVGNGDGVDLCVGLDLYLNGLRVADFTVGCRNGDGCLACIAAVEHGLAVRLGEVDHVLVGGGVGQGRTLKAEERGGNGGGQLHGGVTRVALEELANAVVLNDVLCGVGKIKLELLVVYGDGKQTEEAAGGRGLGVERGEVNGADLAVKGIKPSKIAAVALRVGVGAGLAVQIKEVVVDKAAAGNLLDQGVHLVDLRGDVLGNGGLDEGLDRGLGDPGGVKGGVALIVGHERYACQLVAARVAKLLGAFHFAVQDPVVLGAGHLNGVADLHSLCGVHIVDVDGGGAVHQDKAAGLHAGGKGDAGNDTLDLEVCAGLGLSCLGNRCGGVIRNVNIALVVYVLDQAGVLDLLGAVIVLQDAVEEDLVTLDGLVVQLGVGLLAVGAVGAVNVDRAGGVLDHHLAVLGVLDALDGGADVVALGGDVAGLAAKLESLGDGDGLILRIGLGIGLGGGFGVGLIGVRRVDGAGNERARHQHQADEEKRKQAERLDLHAVPLIK